LLVVVVIIITTIISNNIYIYACVSRAGSLISVKFPTITADNYGALLLNGIPATNYAYFGRDKKLIKVVPLSKSRVVNGPPQLLSFSSLKISGSAVTP